MYELNIIFMNDTPPPLPTFYYKVCQTISKIPSLDIFNNIEGATTASICICHYSIYILHISLCNQSVCVRNSELVNIVSPIKPKYALFRALMCIYLLLWALCNTVHLVCVG